MPSSSSSEPRLAPIHILPAELLCNIFTLGIPEQTDATPAVSRISKELSFRRFERGPWRSLTGPWAPGQVCSYWRTLSVSLPILWTSITVDHNMTEGELHLFDAQLTRTRTAPLDLFIRFNGTSRTGSPFFRALTALVSQSSRWRTLHLRFGSDLPLPTAFDEMCLQTLPLLEQITFGGDGLSQHRSYDFFRHAPALRGAVLGNEGVPSGVKTISLPWRQLTTYKATYVDAATHIRHLAAAPNLVECDIGFRSTGPVDDFLRHVTLVLPHLRRLALSHPPFLARLTTPALRTLYLFGSVDPVLPFLQRSGRTETLTDLTLAACTTPTSEIVAFLRQMGGLTSLALDLSTPPAELVAALVGSDRLCPASGSLKLTDWNDELDRDAFVDMLASRCRGTPGVRVLYFVAIYSGRRRMGTAAFRLRALPTLEVLVMNSKKGRLAVRQWRAY
ncbi:hypothetical protein C8R47DRAFT_1222296 [Mycena vitilis]|nr:hypothetical protein C8R47DRAFT_1222296 [Mycena vitilis]